MESVDPFGPTDIFGGADPTPRELISMVIIVVIAVLLVRIITRPFR